MTKFATGRPATGRNKTITIRISDRAAEILKDEHNKSELIDKLIIYYDEHLKIYPCCCSCPGLTISQCCKIAKINNDAL